MSKRPVLDLRGVPLRWRLTAALVVLVAVGLLVSGVAGTSLLRTYLLDRVDAQLADTGRYNLDVLRRSAGAGRDLHPADRGERLGARPMVFLRVSDASGAQVRPDVRPDAVSEPRLPPLTSSAVDDRGRGSFTVPAVSGDTRWRVVITSVGGPEDHSRLNVAVAVPLTDVDRTVERLALVQGAAGSAVLAALGLLAYISVRVGLRPLHRVEQTASAIAAGDLGIRVAGEDERTETGRLALAFNAMLGRLDAAFAAQASAAASARQSAEHANIAATRLRQVVGDASHELRTPLTSIRGFAELYRIGAVAPGPSLDRAMQRIEAEAQRMGALVEEMLLLARLDQHRPLELADVDLGDLVVQAVRDAAARTPDRAVTAELPGEAPLIVRGDDARLRQVITNLLANAQTHTPSGTPIAVRLAREGDRAILTVQDEGPGLTSEQSEHVFERFYRTDSSRSRSGGGSGLGLAIVAAIVESHGGSVAVRSTPGHGATFTVELQALP